MKNWKESVTENSHWDETLTTLLDSGADMDTDFEQILNSITREDVRKVFDFIVKQNNNIEVIMKGIAK